MTNSLLPGKFTGIIQLIPMDESSLRTLQREILGLYPEQQPISKLHCTLLHQSFPKQVTTSGGLRGDKALKALYKSEGHMGIPTPRLIFGDIRMGFTMAPSYRRSTYIEIENSEDLIDTRNAILELAGLNPDELNLTRAEALRTFHISLTNLEGTGGASIAYPHSSDTCLELK